MVKAMYAFSADPITYGHKDIIARAARIFDTVVVGVGNNTTKNYMFSLDERLSLVQRSLSDIPNIEITSYQGLLVDYAHKNQIPVVVKGVRDSKDFDYEALIHHAGESQKLGIETFPLFADPAKSHISSSIAKEMQRAQGFIDSFVPLCVKQQLEQKILQQYIIGVTGEACAGKSFVSSQLASYGQAHGYTVHNIELDHLGHYILGNSQEPAYQKTRRIIANEFGAQVMKSDSSIDRKLLGEIVFNDSAKLAKLNAIVQNDLYVQLRTELFGKKGLILLNAALIAESNWFSLCNNNCVVVTADKDVQRTRLAARNLSEAQIQRRLASQYSGEQKYAKLQESIRQHNQGTAWQLDNSVESDNSSIFDLFGQIVNQLHVPKTEALK